MMKLRDNADLMISTGLMALDMTAPLSPMRYTVAAATARELLKSAEDSLGEDRDTLTAWGDLCRVAIEIGRDLVTYCPAEALGRFFTKDEEIQILLDRQSRRRHCDRRGLAAHRNGGWGYLLVE